MDYRVSPDTRWASRSPAPAPIGVWRRGWAAARATRSRPGLYGRTHIGPAISPAGSPSRSLDDHQPQAAARRPARGPLQCAELRRAAQTGYRLALHLRSAVGITPYAAVQAQLFRTPAYSESISPAAASPILQRDEASDTRASSARASTTSRCSATCRCCCAPAWPGRTTGRATGADGVFQALPGASFVVNGAAAPKDSALAPRAPSWASRRAGRSPQNSTAIRGGSQLMRGRQVALRV